MLTVRVLSGVVLTVTLFFNIEILVSGGYSMVAEQVREATSSGDKDFLLIVKE